MHMCRQENKSVIGVYKCVTRAVYVSEGLFMCHRVAYVSLRCRCVARKACECFNRRCDSEKDAILENTHAFIEPIKQHTPITTRLSKQNQLIRRQTITQRHLQPITAPRPHPLHYLLLLSPLPPFLLKTFLPFASGTRNEKWSLHCICFDKASAVSQVIGARRMESPVT